MEIHDFIVVGSGCTGVMAAQTLAERGEKVLVIDGGITDDHYASLLPEKNFSDLRRTDDSQERYFLGDNFESFPENELGTGAQLTPARQFLIRETEKYLPLVSENFSPVESLAEGGLGGGWGLGCCVFSPNELKKAGLPESEMAEAYQVVSDRIGISAANDDARKFTAAQLRDVQEAPPAGPSALSLLEKYASKKNRLNRNGFFLGRPALALLTKEKDGRQPLAFRDMDFYEDAGNAAWRPAVAIRQLRKKSNVRFESGWMATHFSETDDCVSVHAMKIGTDEEKIFRCRRLILSPGVLGTARIVLRSMPGGGEKKLPLLCNPYTYVPCLVPSRLGKKMPEKDFGFAQLSLFHDADGTESDIAMASLYTYRSLLLFRLIRETPLNYRDGRIFMQHIAPALLIAGIHHPEIFRDTQHLFLEKSTSTLTGDQLHVNYRRGDADEEVKRREKKYVSALRSMGAWALKTVRPETGASIHYAGTLPFSAEEKAFTLHPDGKLHGTKNVYVADGSGFTFLPAKGLTLSLMANAHRVARGVK
ncbi:MAG TPA: GMC oxidoreductase [Bacteroidia bacterium]|nr:GMC oxidoreductase [Bacteroidia bacterium]